MESWCKTALFLVVFFSCSFLHAFYRHTLCCFLVIYLSFCVFDNAIKGIIQSPCVAKVHLLPAKEQHNSILGELLRHRESS